MHSCQSDLSQEAIDRCPLGIGATLEAVNEVP
jgi:hypothetical protein